MSLFDTPEYLLYSPQQKSIEVSNNYQRVFSESGNNTFTSGDICRIKVSSSTSYLKTSAMFLQYDIQLTGGSWSTSGSCSTSGSGLAMAISRVTETLGGDKLSDIENYGVLCTAEYAVSTPSMQNYLNAVEGLGDPNRITVDSNRLSQGVTVCHALRMPICQSEQLIPLPFIRDGYTVEIYWSQLSQLLTSNSWPTPVTGFKISNVQLIVNMVQVPDDYLKKTQEALVGGKQLALALRLMKSVTTTLKSSTLNDLPFSTGYNGSLDHVIGVQRLAANLNNQSAEEFTLSNCGLKEYHLSCGSQRFPANFEVSTQTASGSTRFSPQQLALMHASIDGQYQLLNMNSSSYLSNGNFILSWQFSPPGQFGSGLKMADNSIVWTLNYNSAPSPDTVFHCFMAYSAYYYIGPSFNTLDTANV